MEETMADNAKTQSVQGIPQVNAEQPKIDPDVLVDVSGEEEEQADPNGRISVDVALDPQTQSAFEMIGNLENPGDGDDNADFGVDFGEFIGRERQGVDVGPLVGDGDGTDPESPEPKYGTDMISARTRTGSVTLPGGTKVTSTETTTETTTIEHPDGSWSQVDDDGTIISVDPADATVTDEAETGDVYEAGVIDLSAIGEAVNDFFNSVVPNGSAVGGGAGTPAEDYISPEERERLQEELKNMSPGAQLGRDTDLPDGNTDGNIDPTEEGGVLDGVGGEAPDIKERYLGGDNVDPDFGGGHGGEPGDPPSGGNTDGNIDWGQDATDAPGAPVYEKTQDTFEAQPDDQDKQKEESATSETAARAVSPFDPISTAPIPTVIAAIDPELVQERAEILLDDSEESSYGRDDADNYGDRVESREDETSGSETGSEDTVTFDGSEDSGDPGSTGTGQTDEEDEAGEEDEAEGLTVGSDDTPNPEDLGGDPVIDLPGSHPEVVGPEPVSPPDPSFEDETLNRAPVVDYEETRPELETISQTPDEPEFELKTEDPFDELAG